MSERPEDIQLRSTFRRSVDDGAVRLKRKWPNLLATGFVGGVDVGLGVLALLLVESATGSRLLGALAFGIGFLALTLGQSELFTENFLVPVAAIVGRQASLGALLRLWAATLLTNLLGAWVFSALMMRALPRLADTAVESARFYTEIGLGPGSFALGLIAGMAITIMTWMERGSASEFGKLLSVMAVAFLLAAGPLSHVIVVSTEMFAALHAGAHFSYLEWGAVAAWAGLANLVGGLVLVTVLRLVQVGGGEIAQERRRRPGSPRQGEEDGEPDASDES